MLTLERLENRDTPSGFDLDGHHYDYNDESGALYLSDPEANIIPDWLGREQHVYLHADNGPLVDKAAVALDGGSCRVVVVSGETGEMLLNEIVFGSDFRGGGTIDRLIGTNGAVGSVPDSLVIVPGPGGGPRVAQFIFDSGFGYMVMSASFFAPYPTEFRGGLQISSADVDGDGIPEMLFLPREGGPQLVAMDSVTHETERSFWVGEPSITTAQFEPSGGAIMTVEGWAIPIQYGDSINGSAPTRLWGYDGHEIFDWTPMAL